MKIRKNSSSNDIKTSAHGNAMVYVLIALALLGFLTITLSSQNNQADGQDISDEQAEIYANELISYVASAQQIVDIMLATGSEIDDLDFVNPSSAAFDTPPHIHKVFHPAGGGLNYQGKFNDIISTSNNSGWYIVKTRNVEWTPTTNSEIILSALRVNENICSLLNRTITGSGNIPALSDAFTDVFEPSATIDLDTSICPDCEGYPALCVTNASGLQFGFYNIIAAQ